MNDDPTVPALAGEMLRSAGREVVLVPEGEAAVARYRKAVAAGRPFDLVILDLTVRGGMGGLAALKELQQDDPGVKAAASSGYPDNATLAEHRRLGFRAFLEKPCTINRLLRLLAEVRG